MLIYIFLKVLVLFSQIIPYIITTVLSIFGFSSSVSSLPFGIDSLLVQGIGYVRFLINIFPPFQPLYLAFIFAVCFKIGLKIIAMIPVVRGLLHKT